ncbi:DMT family transporter, partial [Anaerovibrio slackiae]|uniref:DMT family transporter n=1 Tax=Anaerovibrio slackiae TaxID=2652309 RepID=UPI003862FB15
FGTALLVTHGSLTALAISDRALFWGILSAFAAAFYTVQPRWLLMRWPSPQVIGWAMLIGGAAISLIYPPLEYPGILDAPALLSLAYICVLGTAASFWLYVTSTKYILAQEASILNATEPLASIVFSIILLDVMFELPEIIGSLLIIMPIIYITLKRK